MPYAAGLLVLVGSTRLIQALGTSLTAGMLGRWPGLSESIGQVLGALRFQCHNRRGDPAQSFQERVACRHAA